MPIKTGDRILVDYTGSLDDGTIFDTTQDKKPLEFVVGSGQTIRGFDDAVLGLEKGDETKIRLDPIADSTISNSKKTFPRNKFPNEDLRQGMTISLNSVDGKQIPAKITEITDKEVTIDLNHPIAGKNLNFKIKVVDILKNNIFREIWYKITKKNSKS